MFLLSERELTSRVSLSGAPGLEMGNGRSPFLIVGTGRHGGGKQVPKK